MSKFAVVLVTAPNMKTARALARAALQARLIACANLIPKIESHYWWQGKIESGAEVLLVLKTQKSKLAALEKLVLARHPYDTPEFIVLPLSAGNKKYLDWLAASWHLPPIHATSPRPSPRSGGAGELMVVSSCALHGDPPRFCLNPHDGRA
jgi:periplasmic divalent cation tolerance protein